VNKSVEDGRFMEHAKDFLSILDSVIHNKPICMPFSDDSCSQVLSMARSHNVYALVCEKLCEMPDFMQSLEYEKAMVAAMKQAALQTKQTEAFLDLYQEFAKENLHPLVMKGIVCRELYGELCNYRPSGDEDILIRREEFDRVKDVLFAQGYDPEEKNVTRKMLEELQEITFYNPQYGLSIELHVNAIGNENILRSKMNGYFCSVFERAICQEIMGRKIWTMNHTEHFLFLVLHAFKHMMVSGFGIRQVLDILLYVERYGGEIIWEDAMATLEDCSAKMFFSDLIHIGNQYLGFHLPVLCSANCPNVLLEDLLDCGVFGNETQAQRTAVRITEAAVESRGRSKMTLLLKTVFPGKESLAAEYLELVDKPWLLPVCWIKHGLRFLKHYKESRGKLLTESMEISKKRVELLKRYEVI